MSRIRRRTERRRSKPADGSFQSINITPFTDVLLVLLIIFLIAGSSLTPTGLDVKEIVAQGGQAPSTSESLNELLLFVSPDGTLVLRDGDKLIQKPDLQALDRTRPVNLTTSSSTRIEFLVNSYDQLLRLEFQNVRLAEPQDKP